MRVAVIGSVETTATTVHALAESDLDLVGVAGYEPADPSRVSGYFNLRPLAETLDVEFIAFRRVNDPDVVQKLSTWKLDILFVVGISQLVAPAVLATAARGCIGYHPTALPHGRGRAPVAWLTLGLAPGASTLFQLVTGADAGGIFEQVPFDVDASMHAADVARECDRTLRVGLDRLLPRLARGEWNPRPQDEAQATYLGKREWFDGLIDWLEPAAVVDGLIRAAAPPHPGAYCYSDNRLLRILRSDGVVDRSAYRGVPGKILRQQGETFDVQCSPGVVRVHCIVDKNGDSVELANGKLLRTRVEDEIFQLRARVSRLETALSELAP